MKAKKILILITLLTNILSKRAKSHRRSRRLRYDENSYLPNVYNDESNMVDRVYDKETAHNPSMNYYNEIYKYNGQDSGNVMAIRPESDEENDEIDLGSEEKMQALIKKKKKEFERKLIDIYQKGESVKKLRKYVTEINDILEETSENFTNQLNKADQQEEHNYINELSEAKEKSKRNKKKHHGHNEYMIDGEYHGENGDGIQDNPYEGDEEENRI